MKLYRRSSLWKGITAVTLVAAAAAIAILYGILAMLVLREGERR
jgi:hypothetical protein